MPPRLQLIRTRSWSRLADILIFAAGLALFYGILQIARTWLGPYTPLVHISRSPGDLPLYAAYSLLRIAIAYVLSLAFALGFGYAAARSRRAEVVLVPLLDILQSIPVLSFLPGVMLAMVALFPHSQIGLELGAITLIFTGQVWNLAFSFYSSLKVIPKELTEVASVYSFGWWQRLTQLELPHAAQGLVWNSMMSVAGGWFFLMACEMFALGKRDFRLPGLGSYLQTAAAAGDTHSILWGLGAMVAVIVLLDQWVWKPLIVWADKFKFEQNQGESSDGSFVLRLLRRSAILTQLRIRAFTPAADHLTFYFARQRREAQFPAQPSKSKIWTERTLVAVGLAAIVYGVIRAGALMAGLRSVDLENLLAGSGATFLRVIIALVVATLWTVPAGVAIGLNQRLARVAQPLAQIAASVPATALFPVILLLLIRIGGGMNAASVLLMILGIQWYLLFNVIAGAMAIPNDLKEAAATFRFSRLDCWRRLILPCVFPYLVTGLVTAAGAAWNASIIAEYFRFRGRILSTIGLGAMISKATDAGRFDLLLAATLAMAIMVVIINRLLWKPLYRLSQTRFKLEA
ncbi:MAG: ABC transporter permease subunit [Acidobacteriota bacterium]|nr:ABC transporter permease subunit [Acidobacteriota bacterium]